MAVVPYILRSLVLQDGAQKKVPILTKTERSESVVIEKVFEGVACREKDALEDCRPARRVKGSGVKFCDRDGFRGGGLEGCCATINRPHHRRRLVYTQFVR